MKERQALVQKKARENNKSNDADQIQLLLGECWSKLMRGELQRTQRALMEQRNTQVAAAKKMIMMAQKDTRKKFVKKARMWKETPNKGRRLGREVKMYFRKYDRDVADHDRRRARDRDDKIRKEEGIRDEQTKQMKLNFLLTQSELFSQFISKKVNEEGDQVKAIGNKDLGPTGVPAIDAEYSMERLEAEASAASEAYIKQNADKAAAFDKKNNRPENGGPSVEEIGPTGEVIKDVLQPKCFKGHLKSYQLKGLKWLANLHDCGINGILADEMGLGKTVQSTALLAHLAESKEIWGPFIIVSPSSTLHNWQREIAKFCPQFKVLPYWGSQKDRKFLRKDFTSPLLFTRNAPFHVLITSYQLLVSDEKYFQRMRFEFMVLDEAQALKSSQSQRWKSLLGFNARNRLLLTGTPVQNNMNELWALLHFIMPTLFDNPEEFNEWFSKDIEANAYSEGGGSNLNEHQLKRLHMIIKPFMLRRVKKDVEMEMGDKIEVEVKCEMSARQKTMYSKIRSNISMSDLIQSLKSGTGDKKMKLDHLMNLVMQFRKVCNHPEIFERKEVSSPYSCHEVHREFCGSRLGDDMNDVTKANPTMKSLTLVSINNRSLVSFFIPRLVGDEAFPLSCNTWAGPHVVAINNPTRAKLLNVAWSLFSAAYMHRDGAACFCFLKLLRMSVGEAERSFRGGFFENGEIAVRSRANAKTLSTYLSLGEADDGRKLRKHWGLGFNGIPLGDKIAIVEDARGYLGEEILAGSGLAHPKAISRSIGLSSYSKSFLDRTDSDMRGYETKDILSGSSGTFPQPLWKRVARGLECGLSTELLEISMKEAGFEARRVRALAAREGQTGNTEMQLKLNSAATEWDDLHAGLMWSNPAKDRGLYGGWGRIQSPSHIRMPEIRQLIADSGKLATLDGLLTKLKEEGHRVLIFCQMTKMIDILEDYMAYRKHMYVRLDGSSNLADRRDMVEDFQTRDEIFAFLLSTRAGGLGINLTAADTVIFYDNDWNPTQDSQAMDRCHRIGQTKQVTVYRLITNRSVEEKILKRAKAKQTIQKTVYSGQVSQDHFEAEEMLSMLVDDEDKEGEVKTLTEGAKDALGVGGGGGGGGGIGKDGTEKKKPGPPKRKGLFGMSTSDKKEAKEDKDVGAKTGGQDIRTGVGGDQPPVKKAKIDQLLSGNMVSPRANLQRPPAPVSQAPRGVSPANKNKSGGMSSLMKAMQPGGLPIDARNQPRPNPTQRPPQQRPGPPPQQRPPPPQQRPPQ